jgi:hypothetical protein
MYTEKLIDKYKTSDNLKYFQEKIVNRFSKQKLIFGNKISISQKNLVYKIDDILSDSDNFQECEFCNNVIFSGDIREINGNLLCENCISENYSTCNCCGEYIYNDDVKILEEECFCDDCYFEEKENCYKNHKIENVLLINLISIIGKVNFENLKNYQFKIDENYFSLEKHNKYFRLGSWTANCWIDIGKQEENLLKAISYNLGDNINLLTEINKG